MKTIAVCQQITWSDNLILEVLPVLITADCGGTSRAMVLLITHIMLVLLQVAIMLVACLFACSPQPEFGFGQQA